MNTDSMLDSLLVRVTTLLSNPVFVAVLLAVVLLSIVVLGVVLLVRTRGAKKPPAPKPADDRRWRRACVRERRAAESRGRRLAASPHRWLIVGPPAHGKSHLLRRLGAKPRPPLGPEIPHWWTSGRVSYIEGAPMLDGPAPAEDRSRWLLRALERSGDKRLPIHGAMVVVDIRSLHGDPEGTLRSAEKIAVQIAAISDEAKVDMPVILTLTNMDRLPGSTWREHSDDLLTLAPAEDYPGALDDLVIRDLEARRAMLLMNLHTPRTADEAAPSTAATLRFHRVLRELDPLLRSLIRRLKSASRGEPSTAPTQLIAVCLTGAVRTEDGRPPPLRDALPMLAQLARPGAPRRLRRRLWRIGLAGVAAALALSIHHRGTRLLRDRESTLQQTLSAVESEQRGGLLDSGGAERIDALIRRWRDRSASVSDHQGIADALDRYLDAALVVSFIEPSTETLARRIGERSSLSDGDSLPVESYRALRDDLENYLRLTASAADPCADLPPANALSADNADTVLALLERRPWPMQGMPPRDSPLVETARRTLSRTSPERVFAWIADEVEASGIAPPIVASQLSPHRVFVPRELALRGVYTGAAWPLLHRRFDQLGAHARCWSEDPQTFVAALRSAYARHYRAAWLDFTETLALRNPGSLVDAHQLLDDLLDPASAPLTSLQTIVRENTQSLAPAPTPIYALQRGLAATLDGPMTAALASQAEAIASSLQPLSDYPGLPDYIARLATLRRLLDAAADDPSAIQALRDEAVAAIADTRESILSDSHDRQSRAMLQNLLLPPLEALLVYIASDTGGHLRDTFCDRIAGPWRELLADRYPWDPDAQAEIATRDLDRFLNPKSGLLVSFLDEELQPWIVHEGSRLTPRPQGRGEQLQLSPEVTRFFTAAIAASDALYVEDTLRVDLSLTLSCTPRIHRVGLSLGEETTHYTCAGERETMLSWPSEGERQGAWIEAHGRGGVIERRRRPGEWGLWRLLEETSERSQHGDVTEARITLHDPALGEIPLMLRPIAKHRSLIADTQMLAPLRDPALMPPLRLFVGQEQCNDVR